MIPDVLLADTILQFPHDPRTGRVGLSLLPRGLEGKVVPRRSGLAGLPYIDAVPDAGNPPAAVIDPLVQVKILGDSYPGAFVQGHTLRNSPSIDRFRYTSQSVHSERGRTRIFTRLSSAEGFKLEHQITAQDGDGAIEVQTTFRNDSEQPVTLEMLSSFSLGGITPFHCADAPGRLRVHRFRSGWSAEGRLESRSIEELHLERSWSGAAAFSERFGQLGTMPVRRWFPFVAVEDSEAGVIWGAQLAWAGSWQMEIYRQHDDLSLSGGLADREFGHWKKRLGPGESLESPKAFVSCVAGSLDDLCDRLTGMQQQAAEQQPEAERDLPIVFNEWCTTWGDPQHDKIVRLADRLKDSGVRYLVIDAGWYKTGSSGWSSGHGDWIPSPDLFPEGLGATASAIRQRGLIPGLWFEMETVGSQSDAFSQMTDHMLQRDGQPVTVRERRFWNLNDPVAVDFLKARVIDRLQNDGFGYLKIDYNETVGIGSDDADSLGEGLRKQVLGSYRFFQEIRSQLPNLVIENCASGGHRLEPSMIALTSMSSFSDAHELVEIPIIAANLHRLMLPRQCQIWAVLHPSDSHTRLTYSLAATFLGRMCLSGDVCDLSEEQWQLCFTAQQLYKRAAPVIRQGVSRRFGDIGASWRYPTGWQAVIRTSTSGEQLLMVAHAFQNAPRTVHIPLPSLEADRIWQLDAVFPASIEPEIKDGGLEIAFTDDFSATVLLLTCQQS